jgi:hypothetical protein
MLGNNIAVMLLLMFCKIYKIKLVNGCYPVAPQQKGLNALSMQMSTTHRQ